MARMTSATPPDVMDALAEGELVHIYFERDGDIFFVSLSQSLETVRWLEENDDTGDVVKDDHVNVVRAEIDVRNLMSGDAGESNIEVYV